MTLEPLLASGSKVIDTGQEREREPRDEAI